MTPNFPEGLIVACVWRLLNKRTRVLCTKSSQPVLHLMYNVLTCASELFIPGSDN